MTDTSGAEEAFTLLANEIRLEIVRALGDQGQNGGYTPLTFSELQAEAGVEDNGKFTYHLDRLIDHFVERTDRGYLLTPPGIRVYQAVIAGTYQSPVDVDPFPTDSVCDDCGNPFFARYEDSRFVLGCRHCERTSIRYPLPPGNFDAEDHESLLEAASTRLLRDYLSMRQGVCPYCSGPASVSFDFDEVLDTGESIPTDVTSEFECGRCHWFIRTNLTPPLSTHASLVAFCYERGIDAFDGYVWDVWDEFDVDERVESTDPWRVSISFTLDGDTRTLVVDGDLTVLSVRDGPDVDAE